MPFSRRIGFRTSAWSTSSITIGLRSAATRPAKPSPDRDAHAALDLLLDPARRARDQLVAAAVEQQDRARVGVEDLADALEQLVEQRVEPEVRERDVGDLLQLEQPR